MLLSLAKETQSDIIEAFKTLNSFASTDQNKFFAYRESKQLVENLQNLQNRAFALAFGKIPLLLE